MAYWLVTTALEETWRDGESVLFLGEWCRLYARRDRWSCMNAEVLPYHWDDRAKLASDYQYLHDLHERLLADLAGRLNQIHGVEHGSRYWRTLIGPWLGYFTQMLFDRWSAIQQAVARYELSGTVILAGQEERLVPNDMADFEHLFVGDDWNHHIYATILQDFTTVSVFRQARRGDGLSATSPTPSLKRRIKRTLAAWGESAASVLTRADDAFLLATYLPFRDEMRLRRRLGQIPMPWRSVPPIAVPIDDNQRQWVVPGDNRSDFERCVRAIIPKQMPAVYLEGYRQLVEQTAAMPWPKRPRIIWTSVAFSADEVFKAWAAQKVEDGSPLAIGQHGGHYGIGRWSFVEDHEIAISDRYLSWGWSDPAQPKVKPVGQLKVRRPLGVRHAEQAGVLLVTMAPPRYSYFMYSIPVAGQWLDYFDEQCVFVAQLPESIRNVLTVRLYPQDYGWGQLARWRDRFPTLHVDEGGSDIDALIRRSRLYISTYNATTFLESFTMNVPTVIYWNPEHWELRESAIPYFEELERVGIFHRTPVSAAHHVAIIWDDVETWWMNPAVRAARERFMRRFCDLSQDISGRVATALHHVVADIGQQRVPVAVSV